MIPDWQLPTGVDRGLWDYLHSSEMVGGYDNQMAASPMARADIAFCERHFPTPGRLIDLGCGTGRLCAHFAARGYDCVGVDLSEEMLKAASARCPGMRFVKANLVDFDPSTEFVEPFDYAACLFSTWGMIRGVENRRKMLANVQRLLKPGGKFVVHVHNRWFAGLGWKRFRSGDLTMPQAYGGAPLTLHHFSRSEAIRALHSSGFRVTDVTPIGVSDEVRLTYPWLFPARRAYGYLIACERA